MAFLHIDKLEVSGQKGTSVIAFGKNLTIIMGKSETGKSTIYKCFDYLLGGKNDEQHRPFLVSTGYNIIKGYFSTHKGYLNLTRTVDEANIYTETNIPGINTSEPYHFSPQNKKWIGIIFNKIFDIPDSFRIPCKIDGKTRIFSWRTLKPVFMLYEKNAEKSESIILPKQKAEETALLSHLLYILFKTDFTEFEDSDGGQKLRRIRRVAVQKYIQTKRDELKKKLDALHSQEKKEEPIDETIEKAVGNLYTQLQAINDKLQESVDKNKQLTEEIITSQEKKNKLDTTIKNFEKLESQYVADIKRLGLIVDGENVLKDRPLPTKCPFCESPIKTYAHESYIQASKAELKKIVTKYDELEETKIGLENKAKVIGSSIAELQKSIDFINREISQTLAPTQKSIQEKLNVYQAYIELNSQLKAFGELDTEYQSDYRQNDIQKEDKIDYHPRGLFPEDFSEAISNNYSKILQEVSFTPINKVEFDLNSFDVTVNDNPKINRSKGYSSIFNSTMLLALRQYMNDFGQINPHFYFLDSPLHGLMTESSDENNEDDLRKGFFKYIFNHTSGEDQMIVIENTDHHELQNIATNNENVKIYNFTKDKEKGQYGFLNDVYQD